MDPPIDIPVDHNQSLPQNRPLLFLVEGHHDVEFMRRISAKLSVEVPEIHDLTALEHSGRLVFVPIGGGDLVNWASRFAPLSCSELHVYDREIPPETNLRLRAIEKVNARSRCRAYLTSKRSLENYLHPHAIVEAGGPKLELGDDDPVAEVVGRSTFLGTNEQWSNLSRRARCRIVNRVKWWLNTVAVEYMSIERLHERDPRGDILHWLRQVSVFNESCAVD